ncbi:MAG: tripartite tricarboxylate transporter TctB family protein [Burkholderiales bacterium]
MKDLRVGTNVVGKQSVLRTADFWSGVVLASLGAWIIVRAWQWEYVGADGPGAGFFPLWYGIAMLLLASVLAVSSCLRGGVEIAKFDWTASKRALLAWGALAVAVASFWVIGFVLGFGLLCLFMAKVIYHRTVSSSLLVAIILSLGFHLLFAVVLGVALPNGMIGF